MPAKTESSYLAGSIITLFGAPIAGALVGGLLGTFLFPGVGTLLGAVLGSIVGNGVGLIGTGIFQLWKKNIIGVMFNLFGNVGLATAVGALLGTFIIPGLGTVFGGFLGAAFGCSLSVLSIGLLAIMKKPFGFEFMDRREGYLWSSLGGMLAGGCVGLVLANLVPLIGPGVGLVAGLISGLLLSGGTDFVTRLFSRILTPNKSKGNNENIPKENNANDNAFKTNNRSGVNANKKFNFRLKIENADPNNASTSDSPTTAISKKFQ